MQRPVAPTSWRPTAPCVTTANPVPKATAASRVCAPGRMQAPPRAWRHDNRGVLEPLARFAQIEPVDSEI